MKNRKFWNWKNQTDEEPSAERVLELYGTIAEESWFDDDITPAVFKEELFAGSGPITIWINSPGGDCIAASQIYTMLMDYKGDVTVKVDGIAASAATMAFGDHVDMEKAIDMLSEVKESIINAYEIKTGLSHTQLSHMMDDTTWMNAKKAIELGFADDILTDAKRESAANTEGYEFAASAVERSLINKISGKAKVMPEKKPEGRPVDELRASLYKKLL